MQIDFSRGFEMTINVWVPREHTKPPPTAKVRFFDICKEFGLGSTDVVSILSDRRDRDAVDLRMHVAHALRFEGFSLKQIGSAMNRDHTSILNLLNRYENYVTRN